MCVDVSVTNVSGTVSVPTMSMEMEQVLKLWRVEESDSEFSLFDFDQIADATDNFSDDHKLGQGGFGPVYKVGARRTTYCCQQHAAHAHHYHADPAGHQSIGGIYMLI